MVKVKQSDRKLSDLGEQSKLNYLVLLNKNLLKAYKMRKL